MNELKNVLTIGRYLKNKFGEKVYKVPISISGFTCPNIDGTVARGGCSFCENDSFSPNLQEKTTKSVAMKTPKKKTAVKKKTTAKKTVKKAKKK